MSSQLGQTKQQQQQNNPYANVPGYRVDEPANSAWNRTILAYKSAGVPYTIERTETPTKTTSVKDSSSSLGQVSGPQKSTNPELESAILSTFEKDPSALKFAGNDKGSYLTGEYNKGVLTDIDIDKLNSLVKEYNDTVFKENASSRQQNILARQQQINDLTSTLQEAKSSGATSVDIFTSPKIGPPSKIGSVNPQNISEARLQILNLTKNTNEPLSLSYNKTSKEVKTQTVQQQGIESKSTTYQPADIQTALIGGALGGFAQIGIMGLAGISRLTGQTIKVGGATITPTGGIFAQSSNLVEQRVGSDVVSNFLSGKELAKNPTLAVASAIGFGASIVGTGGTGLIGKGITSVKEGITLSKFISKNLPVVTEQISAKEAVTHTQNIIDVFETHVTKVQKQIETLGKTPVSERILGTGITKEALQTQAKTLGTYKEQLLTNIGQLKTIKSSFETLAAKSPTAIVATVKANPIQSIEKLGQGVYGLYYPASSKFAGGIITLGKKGTGSIIQISNKVPEGTKAIRSAEIMSGVRGILRQSAIKYGNLSGPERAEKTSKDVFSYLKGQKSSYEVTYPKLGIESDSFANVSIGSVTEKEMALGKAFVPEPSVIGVGQELTFGNVVKITSENKFALSREIIGTREASYTKAASTGEIHFMEGNLKNVIGNINVLKEPIIVKEFKSGLGEFVGERAKGFNFLASRFGNQGRKTIDLFKRSNTPFKTGIDTKNLPLTGKARSFARSQERAADKYVLENMMKDTSLNPLTKEEKTSLIREVGRRVSKEKNTEGSQTQSFERLMGRSVSSTGGRVRNKNEDEYEMILSGKAMVRTRQTQNGFQTLKPLTKTIQKPDTATRLNEIFKQTSKSKTDQKVVPITTTVPKTTTKSKTSSITITTGLTTTKQITKTINEPIIKTPNNPIPGFKKKPPFDFPFSFNAENGPGGPAGGSGATKAFVGNVPEFQFTGMFNRTETKYGKGGSIPRGYKLSKQELKSSKSFSVFSKASGQTKKSSSRQSKPLSNKFNRLI